MTAPRRGRSRDARWRAGALGALLLAACADGTGPTSLLGPAVTVRTERAEYRPMDVVVVTTTNHSAHTVWDDHCDGGVQGLELLGEWNGSYGTGRACSAGAGPADWRTHGVPIPPGATHVDVMHVGGHAYTGTWRVELMLRDDAGAPLPVLRRASNTFRVVGGWTP